MNVELALVSHTNAGKTTLARTLLGRDVGEVRDQAHVTDLAEAHTLLALDDGSALRLWDTPGFGNSARLVQRLRLADNPIGWLLREAWDRWRDRPFWCSQQAVRAARDSADVVLYLVNAAEDPRDAGYLAAEMQVLRWIGKPVVVLLNQVGPPQGGAAARDDVERWRRQLEPQGLVAEVLPLDAFARCWVHEAVLLDAVARQLPPQKAAAFARLRAAWLERSVARHAQALDLLASQLVATAQDREPVAAAAPSLVQRLLQSVGVGRAEAEAAQAAAMALLAQRLDARTVATTDALIALHGLDGSATAVLLERMRTHFAGTARVAEGRAALWGSVLTGALTGLKADLAAGGLTLGGGLLLGGLLGGLAGAGVARGLNQLSGADAPLVWWSDEALDGLARSALLRYLAVAHFGRGRGRWVEGESPPSWQQPVADAVAREREALHAAWQQLRGADDPSHGAALRAALARALAQVLEELYPGSVPPGLAAR